MTIGFPTERELLTISKGLMKRIVASLAELKIIIIISEIVNRFIINL